MYVSKCVLEALSTRNRTGERTLAPLPPLPLLQYSVHYQWYTRIVVLRNVDVERFIIKNSSFKMLVVVMMIIMVVDVMMKMDLVFWW